MKKILVALALASLVAFASPALAEIHYNLVLGSTFGTTLFNLIGFTFSGSWAYTRPIGHGGSGNAQARIYSQIGEPLRLIDSDK